MNAKRYIAMGAGLAVALSCAPVAATASTFPTSQVSVASMNVADGEIVFSQPETPQVKPGKIFTAYVAIDIGPLPWPHTFAGDFAIKAPGGTLIVGDTAVVKFSDGTVGWLRGNTNQGKVLTQPNFTHEIRYSKPMTAVLEIQLTSDAGNTREGIVNDGSVAFTPLKPGSAAISTPLAYEAIEPAATDIQPVLRDAVPLIAPGASWSPVVRLTNNTVNATAKGATFEVKAPSGAVFADDKATSTVAGEGTASLATQLSADKTSMTLTYPGSLAAGKTLDVKVNMQSEKGNTRSGLVEDGSFAITGGSAFVTGKAAKISYRGDFAAATVEQIKAPTLKPGETGDIVIKYTNTQDTQTATGTKFELVAPAGTTFARNSFALVQDSYPAGWTLTGALSADKRTLSIDLPNHALLAKGWGQLTVAVKADDDSTRTGSVAGGQFRVTGGSALPAEMSVALRYVAEEAAIVDVSLATPALGAKLLPGKPVFTGKGQPGATVTVRGQFGTVLGTGTVNADGDWSVESTISLLPSSYSGSVTQNAKGRTSTAAFLFTVARDTRIVLSSPALGAELTAGKPVFTGTGQAGAPVTVRGQYGTVLATGVVNAKGEWSIESTVALVAGTYAGTVTQVVDGAPYSVPFRFTVSKDAGLVLTAPAKGAQLAAGKPVFTGTGKAGATITVRGKYGTLLGTAVVNAKGEWSIESTINLVAGEYSGTVSHDVDGKVTTAPFQFITR